MTMSTHALGSTNYYDIHNQDNLKADQLRSWEALDSMMISMCSAKSDHVAFNLKLSYLIEHVTCFISSLRLIDSIKTILNYILSKLNTVGNLSPSSPPTVTTILAPGRKARNVHSTAH